MMKLLLLCACCVFASISAYSQGLEDVYVELFHQASPEEVKASDGELNENFRTYRIFVDMEEGYALQAVFGNEDHPLSLHTSTTFFNDMENGARSADKLNGEAQASMLSKLDSWLSMGHADEAHIACPLKFNSSGRVDGELPSLFSLLMDWTATSHRNRSGFTVEDGTWFMLEGVKGVSEENMVLIAQLTTDGQLSFNLNLQVIGPDGNVYQYVAKAMDDGTIVHPALDSNKNQSINLHNQ